jgi:hypothetical protein
MGRGTRSIALATSVAVTISLAACSADAPAAAEPGSWTVLSYSIADTDLEPYMMTDIGEMGEIGSSEDLSIVALVDRAAGYTDEDVLGLGDWEGGKLLEITLGGANELDDLGDVNTGDPQVLADFVARGIAEYPADNYALVISDHGASWPGVGGDESSDSDSLSLAEIHDGIAAGLEGSGVEKLDLLGFDACLMATFEVATAMAPLADRMLASQELEPGHGWDYTALSIVQDNGGVTTDELGSALIDGFEAQSESEETDAEITLSLVDLEAMPAVSGAVDAFSGALVERAASIAPTVGRSLASTLGFGRSADPDQDSYMTDLGILAGDIGVDALDVSDQADDVVRAINDAVLDKVDGQATRGATGLSIYFPPTVDYYDASYDDLGLDTGWLEFLSSYYGAGAEIPAKATAAFADGSAEYFFDDDGLSISATSASTENIAEAYIRYGLVESDGSITFLGKEPADFDERSAIGTWDLTSLEITDGEDTTSAFVDLTIDDDAGVTTIDVPMGYYAADDVDGETYQDALLSLVIDDSDELVSESYYSYDDATGNYGALTADPEGIISPELLSVDEDGTETWFATSDYGLYADIPYLAYDFPALASGTEVYIELTIIDFGGNEATVSAMDVTP